MARVKRCRRPSAAQEFRAKGYYNARRKVFRVANQAVIKAGQRVHRPHGEEAQLPPCGSSASTPRRASTACQPPDRRAAQAQINADRKILADLAYHEPAAFAAIAERARQSLGA